MLGLCCYAGSSPVVASGSCSLAAMCALLVALAFLAVEHGLQGTRASIAAPVGLAVGSFQAPEHRLNSCGTQAFLLHGMWDPPGLGIQPMSLDWQVDSLLLSHQGSPLFSVKIKKFAYGPVFTYSGLHFFSRGHQQGLLPLAKLVCTRGYQIWLRGEFRQGMVGAGVEPSPSPPLCPTLTLHNKR